MDDSRQPGFGAVRGGLALLALCATVACRTTPPVAGAVAADVVSVTVTGAPGAYRFEVGVRSPDLGCDRYADWWELVDEDGRLVHRRVLAHSHVSEQPFVRSGGPVAIGADTVVLVRAHMHPGGYGGKAFRGSAEDGFQAIGLPSSFASGLADLPPHPPPCAN